MLDAETRRLHRVELAQHLGLRIVDIDQRPEDPGAVVVAEQSGADVPGRAGAAQVTVAADSRVETDIRMPERRQRHAGKRLGFQGLELEPGQTLHAGEVDPRRRLDAWGVGPDHHRAVALHAPLDRRDLGVRQIERVQEVIELVVREAGIGQVVVEEEVPRDAAATPLLLALGVEHRVEEAVGVLLVEDALLVDDEGGSRRRAAGEAEAPPPDLRQPRDAVADRRMVVHPLDHGVPPEAVSPDDRVAEVALEGADGLPFVRRDLPQCEGLAVGLRDVEGPRVLVLVDQLVVQQITPHGHHGCRIASRFAALVRSRRGEGVDVGMGQRPADHADGGLVVDVGVEPRVHHGPQVAAGEALAVRGALDGAAEVDDDRLDPLGKALVVIGRPRPARIAEGEAVGPQPLRARRRHGRRQRRLRHQPGRLQRRVRAIPGAQPAAEATGHGGREIGTEPAAVRGAGADGVVLAAGAEAELVEDEASVVAFMQPRAGLLVAAFQQVEERLGTPGSVTVHRAGRTFEVGVAAEIPVELHHFIGMGVHPPVGRPQAGSEDKQRAGFAGQHGVGLLFNGRRVDGAVGAYGDRGIGDHVDAGLGGGKALVGGLVEKWRLQKMRCAVDHQCRLTLHLVNCGADPAVLPPLLSSIHLAFPVRLVRSAPHPLPRSSGIPPDRQNKQTLSW